MSAQRDYFFDTQEGPAKVPIWRESLMGVDWLALHYSPVYYGLGVPCGDDSAVVVVPGFLATDSYLYDMYYWLWRIGYRGYLSNIGRNAQCLDVLVERLSATIERAYKRTGRRKVHLIGHSLGGVLSRSAAIQHPEMVASVTTMGSPFRGIRSHPLVLRFSDTVRKRVQQERSPERPACYTGYCDCPTAASLRNDLPASIQQTAIYTKSDGIVDWRFCINQDPATNFEVSGTHGGLAFNPTVYSVIARRLANTRKGKKR